MHIRELESLVKQVWATAEHENDKNTIHKMSDLSFFLKTLKPQLKQEWSEEDEQITLSIEQVMNCASLLNIVPEKIDKIKTWLKSLKDRVGCEANCTTTKEWKPSDKQIKHLTDAVDDAKYRNNISTNGYEPYIHLSTLLQQLKKLK